MSGVAAIVSSLDPNEMWLYTATSAQQLGLEVRRKDTQAYAPFQDFGAVQGPVSRTTGLAAVIHNRTTTVYGITYYGDGKKKTVSSLSPIYNPVDSTATSVADPGDYNTIAAASDEKSDYVYFLQDPEKISQQPLVTEYGFQQSTTGTRTVYKLLNPDPSSNLAAVMDARSGTRMIIFQNYKDATLYYAWSHKKAKNPITGSNNALKGSPLAATLVAFEDKTFEVYLYYVDNNSDSPQLCRVIYAGTQNSGDWGAPTPVADASSVHTSSGLAVVSGNNGNYVFLKNGPDKYVRQFDGFKKPLLGGLAERSDGASENAGLKDSDNAETKNGANLEDLSRV